jgi:predicted DNA-binding ribbon-helix-helix protein
MQSAIVKRSIVIAGHKTSVSLEDAFWNGLREIGRSHQKTLSALVGEIDVQRPHTNLSSAIRLFVLGHFRAQISPASTDFIGVGTEMPPAGEVLRQSQQVNGKIGEQPER